MKYSALGESGRLYVRGASLTALNMARNRCEAGLISDDAIERVATELVTEQVSAFYEGRRNKRVLGSALLTAFLIKLAVALAAELIKYWLSTRKLSAFPLPGPFLPGEPGA